jgi:4-hydroxybenzoate polyprenyltransferase
VSATERISWLAWWQLLRVANVFTAASNVIAGFLLVQRGWQPIGPLLLLVLASVLLYEAGMVFNDVCDAELDAVERPERPIPSGRVAKRNALRAGIALLIGGIVAGILITWFTRQLAASLITVILAVTIVLYNVRAKSTRLGLLTMGLCRFLNVCLGASISPALPTGVADAWLLAWAIFFHTYGLTRIARHEADSIDNVDLWVGSASVLMGVVWIIGLPVANEESAI